MLSWEKTETNLSRSRVVLRTRKTVYFAVSMHTFYAFVCMLSSDETWFEQTPLSMFYHIFNHCYSLPELLVARCRCRRRKRREQPAQIRGSGRIIDVLSCGADLLQCQDDWKIGLAFVGTPETFYLMHGPDAPPPRCCVKSSSPAGPWRLHGVRDG